MGRLITTICIFTLTIIISISGIYHSYNTNLRFSKILDEAIYNCKNEETEKLIENIDRLSALWRSRQPISSLYIRHNEMDSVDVLLVTAKAFAESDSFDSTCTELYQLKFMVNHIYEKQVPNLHNLL